MLKECYYFDQKNYTYNDFLSLQRYIDRMIQYRYSTKGSYDGRIRLEEIRNICISRLSDTTKSILSKCIQKHEADELWNLPNLKELVSAKKEGEEWGGQPNCMKLGVDDFYHHLKTLNEEINKQIEKGFLPDDYTFEIKCIGGFAMSYWNVRDEGITENMDSLSEIDDIVKKIIRDIAEADHLPFDWINNVMLQFYEEAAFHWCPVEWYFGRYSRIRIYVCSKEDLLKNKFPMAEAYLEGRFFQDRDPEIDFKDTMNLLKACGMGFGVNPSFIQIKLSNIGISIRDYPKMYEKIITGGVETEPEDFWILQGINKVDRGEQSLEEFEQYCKESFGYTMDDVMRYYDIYFHEFPCFEKNIQLKQF